jgi:acyl-CoA synthetase (AMP-forming)/AMP-acid ligase II
MMATANEMLTSGFAKLADLISAHARERGEKIALIHDETTLSYAALDRAMDRIAAGLQRDGIRKRDAVAILGGMSIPYATVFLGALRAGAVPAPLAPSSTTEQVAAMLADSGARLAFSDHGAPIPASMKRVDLAELDGWMPPAETAPQPVTITPEDPFNIIYSSGTTGTPKGIVQPHAMRWAHIARNEGAGFGSAVTMIATPLYSNTTLVSFLPTLGWGGTAVLLGRFDGRRFLEQAERHRVTHAMLVPVQYARIMADPEFDRFDLSAFRLKTCTSAPFAAALKANVLARWPGLLVEYYGMTEGGGTCILVCNAHPDKLATVGKPIEGHDIRLIDDEGREMPQGEIGEVVGRSPAMMSGYHRRAEATRDAEWFDAEGRRYIRHGDVGRFDEDGFLTLLDRKKDVIISGGFNVYPVDLEAVLRAHPDVKDCTVVGMPSERWGETPVGFYEPAMDAEQSAAEIRDWTNDRLGRTQRMADLVPVEELPRSSIGKVLKRELRDRHLAGRETLA